MWTEVQNLLLTVFKMHHYSNLESSLIRSLIFIEGSLYLKKMWTEVQTLLLTVFKMSPYSNLESSPFVLLYLLNAVNTLKKCGLKFRVSF